MRSSSPSIVTVPANGNETVIGKIPHRLALAGGWIDQPFVSMHNPSPPGSMVVVALEPDCWFMERAGMAGGTRRVALELWGGALPDRPPAELVRELYRAENDGKPEPSGSQDMIGLIYPGISRLDYDARHEDGYFPVHIESCRDPVWFSAGSLMVALAASRFNGNRTRMASASSFRRSIIRRLTMRLRSR